jgi:signal transduction histidine kinase
MDKKYTILIIDDQAQNLQYLSQILNAQNYDVRATTQAGMVLDSLKISQPDLILLDIKMPDIDGYTLCHEIKKIEKCKDIPIIFISALDDVQDKIRAFDEGGVDYIIKPFEPKEVLARVKAQMNLYTSQRRIAQLLEQQEFFIKKIMHEMNTPLSIISLNTQLLQRENAQEERLEAIKASTKTLSSIYSDLSYSIKKDSKKYHKKSIELLSFLQSRVLFFDELLKSKELNMVLECNEELTVYMNEYELERVVDNIISNAIKYSYSGKEIIVFCGQEKQKKVFYVEDFGIGIKDIQTVFNPFFQDETHYEGLGLGLNIVKEICTKYNIPIDIQSEPEKGTKFTFDVKEVLDEPKR